MSITPSIGDFISHISMNICTYLMFQFLLLSSVGWNDSCFASVEVVSKGDMHEPFDQIPAEINKVVFYSFLDYRTPLRPFLELRTINKKSDHYVDKILTEYVTVEGMLKNHLSSATPFYRDLWKLAIPLHYVTTVEKILTGEQLNEHLPFLYKLFVHKDSCVKKLFGLQAYDFFDDIKAHGDGEIIQSINSDCITYIDDSGKANSECPIALACVNGTKQPESVLGATSEFALNTIRQGKVPKILLFQLSNNTFYLKDLENTMPYSFCVKSDGIKKPDHILICETKQPSDYADESDINMEKENTIKRDGFDGSCIDYSYVFLYEDSSNEDATFLNLLLFPSWCLQIRSKGKWSAFRNNCLRWVGGLYAPTTTKANSNKRIFCKFFFPYDQSFMGAKNLFKKSASLFCQSNKGFEISSLFYSIGDRKKALQSIFDPSPLVQNLEPLGQEKIDSIVDDHGFYLADRSYFATEIAIGKQGKNSRRKKIWQYLCGAFKFDHPLTNFIVQNGRYDLDDLLVFLEGATQEHIEIFFSRNDLQDNLLNIIRLLNHLRNKKASDRLWKYIIEGKIINYDTREKIFVYVIKKFHAFKARLPYFLAFLKDKYNEKIFEELKSHLMASGLDLKRFLNFFMGIFENKAYRGKILSLYACNDPTIHKNITALLQIWSDSNKPTRFENLLLDDYATNDDLSRQDIENVFKSCRTSLFKFDFISCAQKYPELAKLIIYNRSIAELSCDIEKNKSNINGQGKLIESIFEQITDNCYLGKRNFAEFFSTGIRISSFLSSLDVKQISYVLAASQRCGYILTDTDLRSLKWAVVTKCQHDKTYDKNIRLLFNHISTWPLKIAKHIVKRSRDIQNYFTFLHFVTTYGIDDEEMCALYYKCVLKWRTKGALRNCCMVREDMERRGKYIPNLIAYCVKRCEHCAGVFSFVNIEESLLKEVYKNIMSETILDRGEMCNISTFIKNCTHKTDVFVRYAEENKLLYTKQSDFLLGLLADSYILNLFDPLYELTEQDCTFLSQNRKKIILKVSRDHIKNAKLLKFLSKYNHLEVDKTVASVIEEIPTRYRSEISPKQLILLSRCLPEVVLQIFRHSITRQKIAALTSAVRSGRSVNRLDGYLINNVPMRLLLPAVRYYHAKNISPVDYVDFEKPFFKMVVLLAHAVTCQPMLTLFCLTGVGAALLYHRKHSEIKQYLAVLQSFFSNQKQYKIASFVNKAKLFLE